MSANELADDDAPSGWPSNRPPLPDWLSVNDAEWPEIDHAALRRALLEEGAVAQLIARKNELLGSASRCPKIIDSEDLNKRTAELVRMINSALKAAKAARESRKDPFLRGGQTIDAVFAEISGPLTKTKETIENRITLYQREVALAARRKREEEARRQKEEADRLAIEAAKKAAAMRTDEDLAAAITANERAEAARADAAKADKLTQVKAAELSRTRSELGAVASLHTFWDFRDLDRETIDLEALRAHLPQTAIEQALRAYIKAGGRQINGAKIFENSKTAVR